MAFETGHKKLDFILELLARNPDSLPSASAAKLKKQFERAGHDTTLKTFKHWFRIAVKRGVDDTWLLKTKGTYRLSAKSKKAHQTFRAKASELLTTSNRLTRPAHGEGGRRRLRLYVEDDAVPSEIIELDRVFGAHENGTVKSFRTTDGDIWTFSSAGVLTAIV